MRRTFLLLATIMGCSLVSACVAERPPSLFSPVEGAYLENEDWKAPPRLHYVRLTITNHQDRPIWYLLPDNANRPLPERGVLTTPHSEGTLTLIEHTARKGTAYEVRLAGGDFRAFRLPARGKLEFARLQVGSNKEQTTLRTLEIMEATDLLINGTESLNALVPANAQTSAEVRDLKIDRTTNAPERPLAVPTNILSISAASHRFWMAKLD